MDGVGARRRRGESRRCRRQPHGCAHARPGQGLGHAAGHGVRRGRRSGRRHHAGDATVHRLDDRRTVRTNDPGERSHMSRGVRGRSVTGSLVAAVVALTGLQGCALFDDDDAADTTTPDTAEPPTGEAGEISATGLPAIPAVVETVSPAVVAIRTSFSQGSGVIWQSDGIVVTNDHVVTGASDVQVVLADGTAVDAQIQAADPFTDLAVLQIDRTDLPVVERSSDAPGVGTAVVAAGNPLGFENSVSVGIISGERRSLPGAAQISPALVDLLQTDAAISPGNSGGALVDLDGRLVGITVAYLGPGQTGAVSIGFAIPMTTVTDVVEQLIETGEVVHAFAGLQMRTVTPELARAFDLPLRAALIAEVVPGGPAATAGLRAGDVVVGVDGEPVDSPEDVLTAIRRRDPGDEMELTVRRNGAERDFTLVLDTRNR